MKETPEHKEMDSLDEARMSIIQHLAELRTRLFHAVAWLFAGFIISWLFRDQLFHFLMVPLKTGAPKIEFSQMHHKDITEPIFVYLKMCFLSGVFVGAPGILYNVWKFIAPGLYDSERKLVIPFVLSATFFFFLGAGFCYYVVLPYGYNFLLQFSADVSNPQLMMSEYFQVTTKLLLGFAVIFELPVFSMFLSIIGVIDHNTLLKYWRAAVVVAFVIAAIFTPPDVVTQLMMAGPLSLLYGLSVGVAWFFSRDRD